jgi:hypothetical protein
MPCTLTSSKKAKGRRLQQQVCADLLEIGKQYGLEDDDLRSTPMGCSGVDVLFSPAARRVFGPTFVECKNREALNVPTTFWEHENKYYAAEGLKLLVHMRNHTKPLVTLKWSDFITLWKEYLNGKTQQLPIATGETRSEG